MRLYVYEGEMVGNGAFRPATAEDVTPAHREAVMGAVAAQFGACANVTADKIIAAFMAVDASDHQEGGGDRG